MIDFRVQEASMRETHTQPSRKIGERGEKGERNGVGRYIFIPVGSGNKSRFLAGF